MRRFDPSHASVQFPRGELERLAAILWFQFSAFAASFMTEP